MHDPAMTNRLSVTTAALFLVALLAVCSPTTAVDDETSSPSPSPSVQPLPVPPITEAARLRDALLAIATRRSTTNTASAFGVVAAWIEIFPRLRFTTADQPATTETVSGADGVLPERRDETTVTVSFAVVDTQGRCAGGYMSGPGLLVKFEAQDPRDACNGQAVWQARNPEPEPSPTAPARSSGSASRRSGSQSSGSTTSEPQTRRGHVEQRPLRDTTVSRPPSA